MSVANPHQANDALDALGADRHATAAEVTELQRTRDRLEQPADPIPDGGEQSDVETAGANRPGFAMTADRRVGAMTIPVEGEGDVRFGKPSGRTSTKLLEPLQRMDREGGDVEELGTYVWHTLAKWSLDDECDADYWATEQSLVDSIETIRGLALGGNVQGR